MEATCHYAHNKRLVHLFQWITLRKEFASVSSVTLYSSRNVVVKFYLRQLNWVPRLMNTFQLNFVSSAKNSAKYDVDVVIQHMTRKWEKSKNKNRDIYTPALGLYEFLISRHGSYLSGFLTSWATGSDPYKYKFYVICPAPQLCTTLTDFRANQIWDTAAL